MIIIGIILAIFAAAIGTTSKQLIALSEHLQKPWLFHLGAGMNVALGPVVDASAYAFAPQVIVAPFACLDVIFNALTAPYTLRWQQERLTRVHFLGTICVAVGAVFTSLFANVDNKIYDVFELEAQLFLRPTSLVYLAIELLAICTANIALKKRLLSPAVRGISLGVIAGVLMGNVFFLKGLIGLIQTSASTGEFDAWIRPTPYVLAACAAGGAVYGHVVMRKGLGEYKGVFMVTIFEGAHISAACLSGCVVMEEMAGAPWWQYVCYWGSVLSIVSGMLVINLAAADAQIEGKFHIAQSFAEVPQEEMQGTGLAGQGLARTAVVLDDGNSSSPIPVVGRPLAERDADASEASRGRGAAEAAEEGDAVSLVEMRAVNPDVEFGKFGLDGFRSGGVLNGNGVNGLTLNGTQSRI